MTVERLQPQKVDLIFKCDNEKCRGTHPECRWPATFLVNDGTPICNDCDRDMILVEVEVEI